MLPQLAWDEEALRLAGVRSDALRALLSPSAVFRTLTDEAAAATGRPAGSPVVAGGITCSPLWAQILADVLGVPLMALEAADASAVGAALLGLRALDCITDPELTSTIQPGPLYSPDPARHTFYARQRREFHILRHGMSEQGEALARLRSTA